jgi:hypothetical protein
VKSLLCILQFKEFPYLMFSICDPKSLSPFDILEFGAQSSRGTLDGDFIGVKNSN